VNLLIQVRMSGCLGGLDTSSTYYERKAIMPSHFLQVASCGNINAPVFVDLTQTFSTWLGIARKNPKIDLCKISPRSSNSCWHMLQLAPVVSSRFDKVYSLTMRKNKYRRRCRMWAPLLLLLMMSSLPSNMMFG
jgi:hypothetical protein